MKQEQLLLNNIGWYGKIPSCGDFVQRRLPTSSINQWAQWFQSGLAVLRSRYAGKPKHSLASAPVWNFAIPATLGCQYVQLGCLLPAQDRIGRQYPICAIQHWSPHDWIPGQLHFAADWYNSLSKILLDGINHRYSIEQLDQALLGITPLNFPLAERSVSRSADAAQPRLSWPQAADYFDPSQYCSFWWSSHQTEGIPFYTHIHSGNFTVQLFSLLFTSHYNVKVSNNRLYPQMFD